MSNDDPTQKLPEDADDSSGRPDEMMNAIYALQQDMQRLFTLFNSLNENFNSLNESFVSLDEKVDKRLQDTRPMWEAVQDQLKEMDERFMARIDGLQTEMRDEFRKLTKKVEILTQDVMDVRTENRLLEDRITKIERKPS
ncbi:MAG: hypothetical protein L0229_20585 [Blastocatellia bacterium]|nr:hypothetical protein [Blastocatellia bacterium]